MIRLKFINTREAPHNGYTFVVPETGFRITERALDDLYSKIQRHYDNNDIPLPSDWKERVEDSICRSMPESWCYYQDSDAPAPRPPTLTAESVLKGIASLATMVKEVVRGDSIYVSQEEAERRASICSRCNLNQGIGVCMGCGAMKAVTDLASNIRGGRSTSYDFKLQNCSVCGCRNDTIVHISKKVLLSGEKTETTEARPSWCWVKNDDLNQAESLLKL
jgi:hypothetical protein